MEYRSCPICYADFIPKQANHIYCEDCRQYRRHEIDAYRESKKPIVIDRVSSIKSVDDIIRDMNARIHIPDNIIHGFNATNTVNHNWLLAFAICVDLMPTILSTVFTVNMIGLFRYEVRIAYRAASVFHYSTLLFQASIAFSTDSGGKHAADVA